MPATLVVGFLVDYITFTSIQISITFTLLLVYWAIAGATIVFINLYDAGKLSQKFRYARLFAPLVIQFTFGALLGSSMVFYWLSGALSVSWPIIVIVAVLMVFNDIFRHYFLKTVVLASVYFFITFSLFSLILPFLFKSLSPWLFVIAGAVSIAIFYPYIKFLPLGIEAQYSKRPKKRLFIFVFSILGIMNFLYFANVIPPIPLSLREAGLYHSLNIEKGKYLMQAEPETFWESLTPEQALHVKPGQKVYFYTAIFAPAKLKTTIFHHWQYYNKATKEWENKDALSFDIAGGRKEGYKGYSFKSNLAPGTWRIFVKNERGQVLGRVKFDVERQKKEIGLREVVR